MSTEVAITTSTSLPVVPNGHEAVSNGSVSKSNESTATTQTSNIVVSVVAVSSSPSFIPSTSTPAPQLFSSPHPLGPNPLAAAYQTLYPGAYPYQYPFLPFPAPFPGAFPAVPYDPQALAPLTSYLPSVMAPLRPPFMSHTPVGPLFFGQTSLGPTSEPAVTSSANSTQPTSNSQTAIDSNGTSGTAATSLSAIKARTGSSRGLLGSTPPGQKSGQRTNMNGTSASNSNSSPNKGINYGGFRNYGGFSKQTVYSHGSSNHRTLEAANNYGGFATISSTSSSHNSVSQNTSSASVLKSSRPESGPNMKQDLPSLKEEDQTRLDQEKKELQEKTNKTIESLDWKSPRNRY